MFHVRRRPADYVPRKRKKKPAGKWSEPDHRYEDERLPFLLELNSDGTEIPNGTGVRHRLQPNVTEVGSERPIGTQAVQAQTLTLTGPTVMPRHCVIAFTENIVTLTPCTRDAHTYVNNQRIHQTTILQVIHMSYHVHSIIIDFDLLSRACSCSIHALKLKSIRMFFFFLLKYFSHIALVEFFAQV